MILDVLSKQQKKSKIPSKSYWRGQKLIAKLILNKLKKDSTILDIGIGQGGSINHLLKKQPKLNIIGFDINQAVLKKANGLLKKKCKGKYKLIKLSQDSNLIKYFGREKFNFVISCGSFDYSKNPDKIISYVKQLLKPGGYFAFTLFDNLSSTDYDGKSPKQRYVSLSGIKTWGYRDFYVKKLLRKLNFQVCSLSLGKKVYKNSFHELSHSEIQAIKKNLAHPYDDHFVILVRKK